MNKLLSCVIFCAAFVVGTGSALAQSASPSPSPFPNSDQWISFYEDRQLGDSIQVVVQHDRKNSYLYLRQTQNGAVKKEIKIQAKKNSTDALTLGQCASLVASVKARQDGGLFFVMPDSAKYGVLCGVQ